MRRGLIVWNPEEIPPAALDARLARLRAAMAEAGLDGMILYTNFVRPAAVAWVSSFSPYWADAILFIPADGQPIFATSMSTRMNGWIRTVNPVGEVVNTRRPGVLVGEWLRDRPAIGRVGVVEIDGLPAGIHDDLVETAPAVALVEASALFAAVRGPVDETEHHLLTKADALARAGLAAVDPALMRHAGPLVGAVEQAARLGGAEEAYIALAADLAQDTRFGRLSGDLPVGDTFAIRASVAYKGVWVRRIRSYATDPAVAAALVGLDGWFAALLAGLDPGQGLAAQVDRAARARGAEVLGLMVEQCTGTYPLQAAADAGAPPRPGVLHVVSLTLAQGALTWAGAAPVVPGDPLGDTDDRPDRQVA